MRTSRTVQIPRSSKIAMPPDASRRPDPQPAGPPLTTIASLRCALFTKPYGNVGHRNYGADTKMDSFGSLPLIQELKRIKNVKAKTVFVADSSRMPFTSQISLTLPGRASKTEGSKEVGDAKALRRNSRKGSRRGPRDHINMRIPQLIISGIPLLVMGLGTRMQDRYACIYICIYNLYLLLSSISISEVNTCWGPHIAARSALVAGSAC